MKILLTGGSGQLGTAIKEFKSSYDILSPTHIELDITDSNKFESIIQQYRPDIILNTAAYHNVIKCEQNPQLAFAVNAIAVHNLARLCEKYNIKFVTISTDYVFDGKKSTAYSEQDRTNPLQVYGASKFAGECLALAAAPDQTIIIRTCGLYGRYGARSKGGNFVLKRLQESKSERLIEMSCDQTVCPTSAFDLSSAILKLITQEHNAPGIYHLTSEGRCTWYEFTLAIYQILNISMEVTPVKRLQEPNEVKRPANSSLLNLNAKKLGIILPHWRESLEQFLQLLTR